eukprot:115582_1
MSASEKQGKWIDCASFGDFYAKELININPNEFLAIKSGTISSRSGFLLYNSQTDTFNDFILSQKCHTNVTWRSLTWKNIAFDAKKQQLYAQLPYGHRQMYSIDTTTNGYIIFEIPTADIEIDIDKSVSNYLLVINNFIHIINAPNSHWIGSISNDSTTINTVQNISQNDIDDNDCLMYGKAIYISSKQYIVLIGGVYDMNDTDPIPG